jgi:membrane protease YdiL (CAAX protease family)
VSVDPGPELPGPAADSPSGIHRVVALLEVVICSDFPTQLALGTTFNALGFGPYSGGRLQVGYVVAVSLVDTVVLVGLVFLFLYAHGERPREILLDHRPVASELAYGVPLIPLAIAIAIGVLAIILRFVPWLHTVEHNPFQELLASPRDAWLFALVVVVAGGVREEIQRAFLLHRFEIWLGGGAFGVVATSVAFGMGHLLQGADAAIATGLLGAFWAVVYLRRRSIIAPMVSHAGFDLMQIVGFLALSR